MTHKPGDRVTVEHDCQPDGPGIWERFERHTTDIEVIAVTPLNIGTRYAGIRCDGTRIEWVET